MKANDIGKEFFTSKKWWIQSLTAIPLVLSFIWIGIISPTLLIPLMVIMWYIGGLYDEFWQLRFKRNKQGGLLHEKNK